MIKVVLSSQRYIGYTLAHRVQLHKNKGMSMENVSWSEGVEQESKPHMECCEHKAISSTAEGTAM